mmetsp:Transcript_38788/g.28685  ORF Transcript_38788/g.28685 Transcript_38788/m.28685 type:complete len:86 (+) Transcript_38788:734-991(+)
MNLVFLICDAPTHGKQYYDETKVKSDYHIDKIENGSLEKTVLKFKEKIPNLQFECITITNHTDKMFKMMQEAFPEIKINDKIVPQ